MEISRTVWIFISLHIFLIRFYIDQLVPILLFWYKSSRVSFILLTVNQPASLNCVMGAGGICRAAMLMDVGNMVEHTCPFRPGYHLITFAALCNPIYMRDDRCYPWEQFLTMSLLGYRHHFFLYACYKEMMWGGVWNKLTYYFPYI